MELRQLQCFVECAKTQSFSQAASLLFTTQSNVSKMISSLEEEFGHRLFIRKQRGIELTPKGLEAYRYALNIVECSDKLLECIEEKNTTELHICVQSSNWFATAFTDFFVQNRHHSYRYFIKNATVDEIIRRLSNNVDQLGFAYIEVCQLEKLKPIFETNHIDYMLLKKTSTVLSYGKNAEISDTLDFNELADLPLIQGFDDEYSGLAFWRNQVSYKPNVLITTDSNYVMKEIIQRTDLSSIGPDFPSHREKSMAPGTISLLNDQEHFHYIALFRDDFPMDEISKRFLQFIKNILKMSVDQLQQKIMRHHPHAGLYI